jgi:hypothetical protein
MAIKYEYKLILVVSQENLQTLQQYRTRSYPENTTFPGVRSDDVTFSPVYSENVVFGSTQGAPELVQPAHTTFFQVPGTWAAKPNSEFEIITLPLRKGMTSDEVKKALEDGALKPYIENCQHYALFAVIRD